MPWSESDLQLAILCVLLDYRESGRSRGGTSYNLIRDLLNVDNEDEFETAIVWLKCRDYLLQGKRVLVITEDGIDYLEEMRPYVRSRGGQNSGGSGQPGWWPPPNDPDDLTGVRPRRSPDTGGGEIVLPRPPLP